MTDRSQFTVVFEGDLSALPFNPMAKHDSPFGRVIGCGYGNAFDEAEELHDALHDAVRSAGRGEAVDQSPLRAALKSRSEPIMTKHTDEETLANALIMTGCKDAADLIDMANVGRSMMERMAQVTEDGPLKGWAPADDPAEIVTDLRNALDDALHDYGNAESECKAAEARVEELEAALQAAEARARTAETESARQAERIKELETIVRDVIDESGALIVKAIREPSDENGLGGWTRAITAARKSISATPPAAPSLPADVVALVEGLKPFAAVSRKAKGKDDACWCGQDGAVIRYADLRTAERLVDAFATRVSPAVAEQTGGEG